MAQAGGNGNWDGPDLSDFARRAGGNAAPFMKRYGKWLVLAIVAIIALVTSYFQVESYEVAIVTRFGEYVRKAKPGAHFKLPFGIEQAHTVPVQRQLKQEFGFRTVKADVRSQYSQPQSAEGESTMLTGDLNVANVEWIIQYRIEDPEKFLFRVRNVNETLRDMSEATMRQVVGDHSVTEVLTIGREAIQAKAKKRLQELCDQYENGIQIVQLVLQDVNPPKPVRASFNEVNEANQERERMINEAEARYNRIIPEAKGQAKQTVQEAEGYATERVNRAQGDVKRFLALQKEYNKAPDVTRTRLYLEMLSEVLPEAERRVVVDQNAEGLVSILPLDRMMSQSGGNASKGGAK